MALIIGGNEYPCATPVRDWREHGMQHEIGEGHNKRRKKVIDLFVLHWTGGEGSPQTMHRVLEKRDLGVEFMVDREGVIWQFADPIEVDTADAGYINPRSVGVEITNYGHRRKAHQIPRKGRDRETYITTMRGRKRRFARFYEPQILAAMDLCDALVACNHPGMQIPRCIPRDDEGCILTETMRPREVRNYSGIIGHFHISKNKSDPGIEIFERLCSEDYR